MLMAISRKIKLLFILLMAVSYLSGCWSRNELTELAIVSGMAIDQKDDQYLLTVQVVNPGEIAGRTASTRLAVTTYEASGKSIFQAIRRLSKQSAKRLYFAHLRLLVIDEDVAKSGISKILDLMSRDHEFRTDFFTVVAKGVDSSDTLKILTALEKNPANKIFTSLEVSHSYWAPTLGIKLDDLIAEITAEGDNPVLTGVTIAGDKSIGNTLSNVEMISPAASINIDHLAVFKGDKLIGWLNEDESKGHNYITDQVDSTLGVFDWEDGNISVEIRGTKTKTEAKITNGKPKIIVDVTTEAQVGEVQAKVDLLDGKILKELEEKLNQSKEEKMTSAINKAKELKADIFGFGEIIHRKDPKLWEKVKENWDEEGFVNLEIELKSNSHIRRLGTTNQPFLNDIQGGS